MTKKEILYKQPDIAPSWSDVKSGDFIKIVNIQTPCLVFIHATNIYSITCIDGINFWSQAKSHLPKLEKIYSKAEITLHD